MASIHSLARPVGISLLPLAALGALASLQALRPVRAQEPAPGKKDNAIVNSIGMRLTLIPAGEFVMGSTKPVLGGEVPQHRVRITRPFYLGVTEVTRGQFRRFVETGYRTEAEKDSKGGEGWNEETKKSEYNRRYNWRNPGFDQTDDHPVANVSWNDAVAFAAWLSRKEGKTYRLPTEAEWEYACRAGTTTLYSFGDDPEGLAAVGNIADGTAKAKHPDRTWAITARDGFVFTAPVGRFQRNGFDLYDMHGNVAEWCSDVFDPDYYKRAPVDDPPGASEAADRSVLRVNRGGGWNGSPSYAKSAARGAWSPKDPSHLLGFRVARVQSGR